MRVVPDGTFGCGEQRVVMGRLFSISEVAKAFAMSVPALRY